MDSVLKNVGGPYIKLFSQNLFEIFSGTYNQVDLPTKKALQTVLRTWREYRLFAPPLLDRIDAKIATQNGPQIHVNPDFVKPSVCLIFLQFVSNSQKGIQASSWCTAQARSEYVH
jgi:hypothetical protein